MNRACRLTCAQRAQAEVHQDAVITDLTGSSHDGIAERLCRCQHDRQRRQPGQYPWRCRSPGCWACRRTLVRGWWQSFGAWLAGPEVSLAVIPLHGGPIDATARLGKALRDLRDRAARRDRRWAAIALAGLADGGRLKEDARWAYGVPPPANANYAWLQHILWHLAPGGTAGVVLANGSMSSGQNGEDAIRRAMVEVDVVDCMVALPGQLFYSTQIPACLWFLARRKNPAGLRDRRGEVLFIDARKLGALVDRTRRELSDADVARIAGAYQAWRGEEDTGAYEDVPGFCKAATLDEIRSHNHVLTPGRYVGVVDAEDDDVPFEERLSGLQAKLEEQFAEGDQLTTAIRASLQSIFLNA